MDDKITFTSPEGEEMELVSILWLDAQGGDGHWDECHDVARCVSVGLLVKESDEALVIAQTTSEDGYGGMFAIPVGCIVSIERFSGPVVENSLPLSSTSTTGPTSPNYPYG